MHDVAVSQAMICKVASREAEGIPGRPLFLVLGVGDVASAVAHRLFLDGCAVALHQGAQAPLTHRRKMSFADAWFDGEAELEGLAARRLDSLSGLAALLREARRIPVIMAGLAETLEVLRADVLIDARMRKRERPDDQRGLARLVIGLGPGFVAGENIDWAVETSWGNSLGKVIREGSPLPLAGEPQPIGNVGRERVVYAPQAGRWHIRKDIGEAVAADEMVADLDGASVLAPVSGTLRGFVRDGLSVAAGTKVLEIDPRPPEQAVFTGLGERPCRIAEGIADALADRHTQRVFSEVEWE